MPTTTWSYHWLIGGVSVVLSGPCRLPAALEWAFRRHDCQFDAPADAIAAELLSGTFNEGVPREASPLGLHRAPPVGGGMLGSRYWLQCAEGGAAGCLSRDHLRVYAPSRAWLEGQVFVRTLFPLALLLHLATRGFFYAHAAAVEDPSGVGWLLLGRGGAGKSTTAYALVRRGWRYLGDDGLLLAARPDGVQALPFMDGFHLSRQLGERFPELQWETAQRAGWDKGVVAMDALFPGAWQASIVPRRLVLLHGPAELLTRGPGVARRACLAALVEDNPLVYRVESARHVEVLARLLAQCTARAVGRSSGLLDDPAAVLARAV